MMRIVGLLVIFAAGWLSDGTRAAAAAEKESAPAGCRQDPAYARLDFWVGRWKVVDPKGVVQGDNWIEKTLGGCALIEHWRDAGGDEGMSLFYYHRVEKRWKQVWVTDGGQVKEKAEQLDFPGPGLRFQGRLPTPAGETILDRTTLTLLPDGGVRQLIEQSRDGGMSWQAWEGIYSRAPG